MKKNYIYWIIITFLLVFVLILLTLSYDRGFISLQNTESDYRVSDFVEIDDYKGENFSSPDDFRENSIKGPQYVDREDYRLKVDGLVTNPGEYTYDEVLKGFASHEKAARLNCVEGWSVKLLWEGILVSDILEKADPLKEANTVIFHAVDGYTTSFPLGYIMDNKIIMAHKMNSGELDSARGFPFQLVAESKWGYKWIKWIERIELSDDENYRGYWESRGYSNSGNLWEDRYDR